MKLQRREKILIAVAGGLLVTILGFFFFLFGDVPPVEKLLADRTHWKEDVAKKESQLRAAKDDKARLDDWSRRAVPAEQDIYTNWLSNLATKFITKPFTLVPAQPDLHKGIYTKFSFTLSGHASLANLTDFLYQFYKAGHLHQITRMVIKPVPNSPDLEVNLTVEALSLPGVDRKDLIKEEGHSLQQGKSLTDYRQPITKRNLFAAFVSRDRKSTVDVAQFTYVTGVTDVDGKKLVWIQNRMGGRLWKLGEGEKFEIGDIRGIVQKINPAKDMDEVVLDVDGHRRLLRAGDNLRGGVEVKKEEVKE
jgi:hypothetical protein